MAGRSPSTITESPTADAASGNPLNSLPLRQFIVFVVRAHGRSLHELAAVLGLNRHTVHLDLKAAIFTLRSGVPEKPEALRGRPYSCKRHQGNCPRSCHALRRFLKDFDASMPTRE